MDKLIIRDSEAGDYKSIASLIMELGYPATEVEVKERLTLIDSDKSLRTMVAEREGNVIGFIGLSKSYAYERNGCYIRITALVVSSNFRNQGVGRKLVQIAEAWATAEKATVILLNSGVNRNDAHRFYESQGFSLKGYSFCKELKSP